MLMLVVAVAVAASASAAVPYDQIVALNDLFWSTNGKGWSFYDNWGVGDPCDNAWFGVSCTNGMMYVACSTAVLPPQ
jgi:hypothetical protein